MSSQALHIVILAAGQGTRMRSTNPKVLQRLAGRPMIEHVIKVATALEATRISVVIGYGAELVRAAGADWPVQWVTQYPLRGTGDAVRKALIAAGTPPEGEVTLVLYGDVPLLRVDTAQSLVNHAREGALSLLTQERADPTGYGRVLRSRHGRVTGIVEHRDASTEQRLLREVNTGIVAAPTQRLAKWVAAVDCDNAQKEYYLTSIVHMAAEDHQPILTSHPQLAWETDGVNDPAQLARLERAYQRWQAEQLMLAGVRLADPSRIEIRGELTADTDVEIDVGCIFEGQVHLEAGVHLGPYVVVRDSHIGAHSEIRPFSHVDGARLAPHCVVGPYARLRPGTELSEHVHVGNFVEVKNSQLGEGSKANHLSYVGDTTVGAEVNIGAGVITCNFDGANKHRTVIGDRAFIGSNSALVAPVKVGDGATIGAGTTLVAEAPAEQLTLARPHQQSFPRWRRPTKRV